MEKKDNISANEEKVDNSTTTNEKPAADDKPNIRDIDLSEIDSSEPLKKGN